MFEIPRNLKTGIFFALTETAHSKKKTIEQRENIKQKNIILVKTRIVGFTNKKRMRIKTLIKRNLILLKKPSIIKYNNITVIYL